jgi:hypothetical protein
MLLLSIFVLQIGKLVNKYLTSIPLSGTILVPKKGEVDEYMG